MISSLDFREKIIIIVYTDDEYISIKNSNVVITKKDKTIKFQLSCYKVLSIWLYGKCTLSSGVMEQSKKFGFSILLLNSNMKLIGNWNSLTEGNFLLRHKQYHYNNIDIAKFIIKQKINNQLLLLKNHRVKNDIIRKDINLIETYMTNIDDCNNINEIMGNEGISSKLFFQDYFRFFDWDGRKPRLKHNYINTLLDIGYTILFNYIENILTMFGFDVYKGVLHQTFYQRKSLVCDMIEPFRCIIDKCIFNSINLKQFKKEDFIIKNNQYTLDYKLSNGYVKIFVSSILEYKEEIFLFIQSYYRAFMRNKNISDYKTFTIC